MLNSVYQLRKGDKTMNFTMNLVISIILISIILLVLVIMSLIMNSVYCFAGKEKFSAFSPNSKFVY